MFSRYSLKYTRHAYFMASNVDWGEDCQNGGTPNRRDQAIRRLASDAGAAIRGVKIPGAAPTRIQLNLPAGLAFR